MQFTQPRHLLAAGVIALVLGHLGARFAYGGLPPLPALAGVTLLLIAAIDLALALNFRPRIQRRPGTEPVNALTAARAVALAKASSMVGAIMAGAWIGLLIYLLPLLGRVVVAQSDAAAAGIGLVSAGALIGAGLWLENCLRNPDEPEEEDEEEE